MNTSTWFHVSIVLIFSVCLWFCWRVRHWKILRYVLITIASYCIHVLVFSICRLFCPNISIETALIWNLWSQAIRIHAGFTILLVLDQVRVLCLLLKASSP